MVEAEAWLVVVGSAFIVAALAGRRIARRPPEEGVHVRSGGAALVAGLVVGLGQAVPMLAVPAFFTAVQGIDGFFATLFVAPFAIALFVAGPLAGRLLARYSPRILIICGIWAIAIADISFVLVMSPKASYLLFIVPFVLVGGGFVIATVIRTAVIFASTPRRMPGTAAALNEASIGVGARVGVTIVVLLRAGMVPGLSELQALQLAIAFAAFVSVVGGVAVFLLLGTHDPVRSVWDLRDERPQPSGGA
jgi:MFS family permease